MRLIENTIKLAVWSFVLLLGAAGAAPARAQTPPATQAAPMPIGVNLEGVSDWARSRMFADAMKSARTFGSARAPWDGQATLGANGWPVGDFGAVVMADLAHIGGTYRLSFKGQARVTVMSPGGKVTVNHYDAASDTSTGEVFVGRDANSLFLSFDNAQHVSNVRLMRPDTTDHDIFSPEFLHVIEPFHVLRLMDYSATNGSVLSQWKGRPTPADAIQTTERGGAIEYAILLANATGKDLWINVPDMADDDFVRHLAQAMKNALKPGHVTYVEYSNELFNNFMPQWSRNIQAAKDEVTAGNSPLSADGNIDPNVWSTRRMAKRSVEISNIFREVYGYKPGDAAFFTRVRPVLCGQSFGQEPFTAQLDWVTKTYGPPNQFLYAIGIAPYPNLMSAPPKALRVDDIITALNQSLVGFRADFTLRKKVADKFNLAMLGYEGGPDVQGKENLDMKIRAQADPRMGQFITDMLTAWHDAGGGLFCYYNIASTYGPSGCWGLTDDITKDTPKMAAVRRLATGRDK